MADYIYTMEIRLTPDQQKGASLVQEVARTAGMNLYLTGGAVRDIISGFPIRDLDFTVQGNPLKLQKDLERGGAVIAAADEELKTLFLQLPGNVRAGMSGIGVYYPDRTPTQQRGVRVDVVCAPTIAGMRAGRDEVLDCALRALVPTP